MSNSYAPIVVFAYNRKEKLKRCLATIEKCKESKYSDIYIFCDGCKSVSDADAVNQVQEFALNYSKQDCFKKVVVRIQEENRGLARSVIDGVTEIVNEYGKVIVVEDDLLVSQMFLRFINEGLDYYKDDKRIGSISAFTYPLKSLKNYNKDSYAILKAECWGWATWADRWNNAIWENTDFIEYLEDHKLRWRFEKLEAGIDRLMYLQFKGGIDSWAVRWVYYLFCEGRLTVYPAKSLVNNDGFDGSGTHCESGFGSGFNDDLSGDIAEYKWEKCELNKTLAKEYARFPRRKLLLYIFETIWYMFIKGVNEE